MKFVTAIAVLFVSAISEVQADCLSAEELKASADVVLTGQTSYVNKKKSLWRIHGSNPYTADNVYNDIAIKLSSACSVVKDKLDLDFSFNALGYYPSFSVGAFEKDSHRSKVLTDQLRLSYVLSDTTRLEGGKLRTPQGIFFLKSPATLLTNFYSAFKATRLYDKQMNSAYEESFWGARLSREYRNYALSLTVAPKLTSIKKYYDSSSNWSANERSNSNERYLLSYTDFHFARHTPSLNLMLGDSPSIAIADSYNYTSQLIINAELAVHQAQQWRHFSKTNKEKVQQWRFPSSLYSAENKAGAELAIGGQYTTDRFSVFGLEYYFQSEGYSKSEWREQTDFIRYLNKKTGYAAIDQAYDNYKYLMGSEISNTSNRGMLQGRHYINAYASLLNEDRSSLQPYLVMNVVDRSALVGIHYLKPLKGMDEKAEIYTGWYSALGSKDSEFALFGETLGIYAGFKYHL